jgi:hemerythrin
MAGCSSEKQAQCLQAFLIKNMIDPERILLITGGNKAGDYDDARQPAFLENINEEAKKYDLIIYTSVLGSGVSIINPAFEFTYLLNSNVLPANESMQMLARNRCAKRVYVAFGKDGNAGRVTDMETLKQGQIEKIKNFAADNGANITGSLNDLGLMQCESRAHINADLNDYANNFLLLAEISGRHFEHENAFIDSDGYGLKESAKETKELIISKIHNAPVLDDIDYKKLKRNYATTQQQTDAVKRFDAVKMTGAAADKLTLGDVENFNNGYASKLNNYLLIDADQKNLKELDKANHESGNNQKSLLSRQKIFKAFLKPLLDANGKIGKKEFQAACKVLKKYHLELAGEFGNYDKEKFKNAGMTVHNFLEKIGYEIAEKSTIQGVSFYEIFVNDDIARYATNRMALDGF